jgi:hypothetical protein
MNKLSDLPRTDRPLNWAIYRDGPRPRPRHDRRAIARAMASKSINGLRRVWGAGPAASFLQWGGTGSAATPPKPGGSRRRMHVCTPPPPRRMPARSGRAHTCRVGRKVGELGTKRKYYSEHLSGGPPSQGAEIWKREAIEIQAQVADLPQNVPYHGGGGRVKDPLFGQLWPRLAPI